MQQIPQNGLVLYRNRPARVKRAGERLELELEDGSEQRVRPKDVSLLHPGPAPLPSQLGTLPAGDVATAWELLDDDTATLAELAELVYGEFTPAAAWAAWQLVADGLYFHGSPEQIAGWSPEEVAEELSERGQRQEQERAWAALVVRVREGRCTPEDRPHLVPVEQLALGRTPRSRLLQELGKAETQENAHALLLKLGHWDYRVNPYPRRFALSTETPQAALPELPEEPRVDLTHLEAYAIDDEGNQDPDDAVSLEPGRLWVHVADVAALVAPDSPADLEARGRGANLYLPEGTVPMLPPAATATLGLGLADISPALSFGLDYDGDGGITGVEIAPSWVRAQRLTYEQAQERLDTEPFSGLYHLAQLNLERRIGNGAVSIEWPEVKIGVEGGRVSVRPLPPSPSRDLVTEAMLMAGEATARFALERGIPVPFSTQGAPEETDPAISGLAGMLARRRSLRRSQLKSSAGPHAGLGLEVYAQATSPLRRYLDLVVHQQLRAYQRGKPLLSPQEVLERVGTAEAASGSVRQVERLANRHWILVYLQERPGWRGRAVLVDRRERRATALIPELAFEAQVHLGADLPPNSPLSLVLQGVDLPWLEAHFQVEE